MLLLIGAAYLPACAEPEPAAMGQTVTGQETADQEAVPYATTESVAFEVRLTGGDASHGPLTFDVRARNVGEVPVVLYGLADHGRYAGNPTREERHPCDGPGTGIYYRFTTEGGREVFEGYSLTFYHDLWPRSGAPSGPMGPERSELGRHVIAPGEEVEESWRVDAVDYFGLAGSAYELELYYHFAKEPSVTDTGGDGRPVAGCELLGRFPIRGIEA